MDINRRIADSAQIKIGQVNNFLSVVMMYTGTDVSREQILEALESLPLKDRNPLAVVQKLEKRSGEGEPSAAPGLAFPAEERVSFQLPGEGESVGLTGEQEQVVHHPAGSHARVLAVAGSGKTTTMAHRIRYLMQEHSVAQARIHVLMFNKLAEVQFKQRLADIGIPAGKQPPVRTFHGFAYSVFQDQMRSGRIPPQELWLEEKEEFIKSQVRRILTHLEQETILEVDEIDVDEAMQAIGLWKASLIPPERAGYKGNRNMALVYKAYEEYRAETGFLTFDDFVPAAVQALESDEKSRGKFCSSWDFLIVDEYQDVNYGQQRLIELAAGQRADLMVVGDDDQTIYEWRGARPQYILNGFEEAFTNKPVLDYHLSRTFRLPAPIAQSAYNAIQLNTRRRAKPVISHFPQKAGGLVQFCGAGKDGIETAREMAEEIRTLIFNQGVPPKEVQVLVRMYSQLSSLEAALLAKEVPYRVLGQASFLQRSEVRVLLNYVLAAEHLDGVMDKEAGERFLNIINKPGRKLGRRDLESAVEAAVAHGRSLADLLAYFGDAEKSPFHAGQRERVEDFKNLLRRIGEKLPGSKPGPLFRWIVEHSGYMEHFEEYYGKGETAFERQNTVESFLSYTDSITMGTLEFIEWVRKLDTTRGLPDDQVVTLTTIYRAKGLEFQHVFIPQCEERFMPCLYQDEGEIYDTEGLVPDPERSSRIDSERRLYYVGITRAKEIVYLGYGGNRPGRGGESRASRFIEESEIDATQELFGAFRRFIQGDGSIPEKFLGVLRSFSGSSRILDALVGDYFGVVQGSGFIIRVQQHIRGLKGKAFSYSKDYDAQRELDLKKQAEKGQRSYWAAEGEQDLPF